MDKKDRIYCRITGRPRKTLDELGLDDLVHPAWFCNLINCTNQELLRKRDSGEILFLTDAYGNERLPAGQVLDGQVIDGIKEALKIIETPLETYRYLRMDCPDGSNKTFLEKLKGGEKEIVLSYFEGAMRGDFW